MINFFRRAGLGSKLSLLTGVSVATLFLLFTFLLSQKASQQLEALAVEDLHNQSTGMVDMVQMFNTSLSEEVESYTRLFTTFLPQPLNIDNSQPQTINGLSVPLLKGGDTGLHENNTLSDEFLNRTGAISTLFVRSGNDFVRVATSLRKENGDRAMGTVLDNASPAFAAVNKGEVYRGLALLFGKRYITQYQPVKNAEGQVIAIVFVGVDITHSWNVMREKILNRRLGESGHFFVLDRSNGKTRGQYLFHAGEEGKLPKWDAATQQQLLSDKPGTLERTSDDGRTLKMAYTPLPGWNWTIVGEVDKSVLLSSVTAMRDRFLLAGVVLSILFAGLFVVIIRRVLTRPLRSVIHLARQYAAGDLRSSLPVTRQDEVGQLIDAINGIGGGLQKLCCRFVRPQARSIWAPTRWPPTQARFQSRSTSRPAAWKRRPPAWSSWPPPCSKMPPTWSKRSSWWVKPRLRFIRAVRRSPTRCRPWTTFAKRQNASKTSRA
ncbi:chemotaxis protein [Enterobacter asburiae]|nr:chemotaxis protein [Enterobacter asburiae]